MRRDRNRQLPRSIFTPFPRRSLDPLRTCVLPLGQAKIGRLYQRVNAPTVDARMICILEISLVRPVEMGQPLKSMQYYFDLDWLPDPSTAAQFVTGLLYRTEKWLNALRLEKHEERVARQRATLPPGETALTLVALEEMCSHHGLARVQGDDFATFFLEWFISDTPPVAFEQGQWLHGYREHQADCDEDFLPLSPGPEVQPVTSIWPAPPSPEQPTSPS